MMVNSDKDFIGLVAAVRDRTSQLRFDYARIMGVALVPDEYIYRCLKTVEKICSRHVLGDLRHDPNDVKLVRDAAQWSISVNCVLRGQEEISMQWRD